MLSPDGNKKKLIAVATVFVTLIIVALAWWAISLKNSSPENQSADNAKITGDKDASSLMDASGKTEIVDNENFITIEQFLEENSGMTSSLADYVKKSLILTKWA